MTKYKKKAIVIDAIQWTGKNTNEMSEFINDCFLKFGKSPEINLTNNNLIICTLEGEIYPCKPDIFEQTYEKYSDKKYLSDYKLGDIIDSNVFVSDPIMRILKSPIELVAVGHTLQDKNGTQATITLKHKDFVEDENEDSDNDYDEDE